MSGKLFLQIVALMIIFAVIMTGTKMLKRQYCQMGGDKGPMSAMCASKMAK
jgi:hypothetical protein